MIALPITVCRILHRVGVKVCYIHIADFFSFTVAQGIPEIISFQNNNFQIKSRKANCKHL